MDERQRWRAEIAQRIETHYEVSVNDEQLARACHPQNAASIRYLNAAAQLRLNLPAFLRRLIEEIDQFFHDPSQLHGYGESLRQIFDKVVGDSEEARSMPGFGHIEELKAQMGAAASFYELRNKRDGAKPVEADRAPDEGFNFACAYAAAWVAAHRTKRGEPHPSPSWSDATAVVEYHGWDLSEYEDPVEAVRAAARRFTRKYGRLYLQPPEDLELRLVAKQFAENLDLE